MVLETTIYNIFACAVVRSFEAQYTKTGKQIIVTFTATLRKRKMSSLQV